MKSKVEEQRGWRAEVRPSNPEQWMEKREGKSSREQVNGEKEQVEGEVRRGRVKATGVPAERDPPRRIGFRLTPGQQLCMEGKCESAQEQSVPTCWLGCS